MCPEISCSIAVWPVSFSCTITPRQNEKIKRDKQTAGLYRHDSSWMFTVFQVAVITRQPSPALTYAPCDNTWTMKCCLHHSMICGIESPFTSQPSKASINLTGGWAFRDDLRCHINPTNQRIIYNQIQHVSSTSKNNDCTSSWMPSPSTDFRVLINIFNKIRMVFDSKTYSWSREDYFWATGDDTFPNRILRTHDSKHRQAAVLEFLELELGERNRVVGVRVPPLPEVTKLSGRLQQGSNQLHYSTY